MHYIVADTIKEGKSYAKENSLLDARVIATYGNMPFKKLREDDHVWILVDDFNWGALILNFSGCHVHKVTV